MARYANKGEATGLYAGGTVDTTAAYSLTGTAVYNIGTSALTSYNTIPLSDVGFPAGTDEIWARLDVYAPGSPYFNFAVLWDGKTGNGTGLYHEYGIIAVYYFNSNGTRNYAYIINSSGNTVNTWKLHISPTIVEVWTPTGSHLTYSGTGAGTEITTFRIKTYNNRVSNIITADYDCTDETLAGSEITLHADTARLVKNTVSVSADTVRNIKNAVAIHADTLRTLTKGREVTLHADTLRTLTSGKQGVEVRLSADTQRTVSNIVTAHADTARNIPRIIRNYAGSGLQSVSMTLAEKTLSDTFRMVTATPFSLQETIQGTLLDFPYTFRVESTSQRELMQTANGMYDVDTLLYNPIKYTVAESEKTVYRAKITNDTYGTAGIVRGVTAAQIARKCCAGISKTAVVNFDNFYPVSAQADTITNYQSILSGIFAWTAQVPRRQINVFMRQGNVHFLQRGKESGVINLDNYTHSRPTIDRSIVRTMWAREADFYDSSMIGGLADGWGDWYIKSITDKDINHGGGSSRPPERIIGGDGLVQRTVERVENDEGLIVITTDYEYTSTGRTKFLTRETITTTQNGETIEEKTIDHYPLENGQRYSVASDGSGNVSSGLGTYPYADSMNDYAEETWELTRGGHWVTNNKDTMKDSNSFPVNDRETVAAIYAELKWMNRKTQETVSLDIIGKVTDGVSAITHVFDFLTRYTLNGNEYYLVSNTVNCTPGQLIQTLNLVRWY